MFVRQVFERRRTKHVCKTHEAGPKRGERRGMFVRQVQRIYVLPHSGRARKDLFRRQRRGADNDVTSTTLSYGSVLDDVGEKQETEVPIFPDFKENQHCVLVVIMSLLQYYFGEIWTTLGDQV